MLRVMIADDEPIVRKALSTLIPWDELGCQLVYMAANGQEVLDALESAQPDLLITDIRMPLLDGLQVAKAIQERNLPIGVIILTAYADFEYAKTALQYNVIDYVVKTAMLDTLPAAVVKAKEKICHKPAKAQKVTIHEVFLRDLYDGSFRDESEIAYMARQIGLELDAYRAVLLRSEDMRDERLQELLDDGVNQQWEDAVIAIGKVRKDRLLLLISGEVADEQISKQSKALLESLRCVLRSELTIGISGNKKGAQTLQAAVEEIRCAFGQAFYRKRKGVMVFGEEQTVTQPANKEAEQLLSEIRRTIILGRGERAKEAFSKVLEIWKRELVPFGVVKNHGLRIQSACIQELAEQGIPIDAQSMTERIMDTAYVEEFEAEMLRVIEQATAQATQSSGYTSALVHEAKEYILEHGQAPLRVSEVARHVDVSPSFLSRIFREREGVTIIQTINALKLERAKEYLKHSEQQVQEIALALGFENITYFSRFFKKQTGVSPKEYRNRKES